MANLRPRWVNAVGLWGHGQTATQQGIAAIPGRDAVWAGSGGGGVQCVHRQVAGRVMQAAIAVSMLPPHADRQSNLAA